MIETTKSWNIENATIIKSEFTDDELLGLGGTARRPANVGKEIHADVLGGGVDYRTKIRDDATLQEINELRKDAQNAASCTEWNYTYSE